VLLLLFMDHRSWFLVRSVEGDVGRHFDRDYATMNQEP